MTVGLPVSSACPQYLGRRLFGAGQGHDARHEWRLGHGLARVLPGAVPAGAGQERRAMPELPGVE